MASDQFESDLMASGLDRLRWENRFVDELPVDPSPVNRPRQVNNAMSSRVQPVTAPAPTVVAWSAEVAAASERELQAYYERNPEQLHADVVTLGLNDQALPQFVRLRFPPGIVGMLVAALMAATMSSIDSGIHSVTTSIVVDFRDRLFPALRPRSEASEMLVARLLVVLIGAIAITLACFVGQLGDVFAVAKKTVGAFAAPLLAMFILGLFVPRARSTGVFIGTFVGAAFAGWVIFAFSNWFAMWLFPIGFFGSVAVSMLFSLLPLPGNGPPDEPPLTFWAVKSSDLAPRE